MNVIDINKQNFQEEVINSDKPVLLDFYADWCAPCRMMSPIVKELAEERSDIKVGKINVDKEQELSMLFKVVSIPMLVLVKDGKVVKHTVGYRAKESLIKELLGA